MKKNPVCAILWRDAAYSYEVEIPKEIPLPRLCTGFIVETNDTHTFIATNVSYDASTGSIDPIDGLIIPEGMIVQFRKVGDLHDNV